MIHVTIRERDASAKATEPITSGSVGLPVRFRFSADWDGLGRIAVFCGSGKTVDMAIKENECVVPHEVLRHFGGRLKIGVYGTGENGSRVTPTVWANAGVILQGAEPAGVEPGAATENLVQQLLEAARSAEELAQSVRNEADAGAFIGPPGPKGDKGDPGPAGDAAVFMASYGMTRLAEIIAANAAGKTVMLMLGTRIYMLCDCQSGGAVFSSVRSGGTVYYVSVSPSDSWSNTSLWLVPVEQMLATTGDPGDLQTSAKNSLVAAINELNQRISGLLPASGVSF